jgi:hypothetical protein
MPLESGGPPPGASGGAPMSSTPGGTPPGASPSTLAGQPSGGDQPSAPSGDEGMKQTIQTIRQMQVQMMDLGRQFPPAAAALRKSEEGLRAALRQIIANPGSPEPPAPNIGG